MSVWFYLEVSDEVLQLFNPGSNVIRGVYRIIFQRCIKNHKKYMRLTEVKLLEHH
jgi:hypothetical protein